MKITIHSPFAPESDAVYQAILGRQETINPPIEQRIRPLPLTEASIGMVYGALLTKRSCKLVLGKESNGKAVEEDLKLLAGRGDGLAGTMIISAAGCLQQAKRGDYDAGRSVETLQAFSASEARDKLIVIDKVDYSNSSGKYPTQVVNYLNRIVNDPAMPMICTVGSFYSPERRIPFDAPLSPAQEFISQLATTFTFQEETGLMHENSAQVSTPYVRRRPLAVT